MDADTKRQLIEAAKKALTIISVAGNNTDFVFELRDLIRKAEACTLNNSENPTSQH